MRSPPIRCCGARLAFVPEGTQSVSVATAKAVAPGVSVTWSSRLAARGIGMKATNGLVDANSGLKPRGEV